MKDKSKPTNKHPPIYIRQTDDLLELRLAERARALVRESGLSETAVFRALLLVGLAVVEKDPGLLGRAAAVARPKKGNAS